MTAPSCPFAGLKDNLRPIEILMSLFEPSVIHVSDSARPQAVQCSTEGVHGGALIRCSREKDKDNI